MIYYCCFVGYVCCYNYYYEYYCYKYYYYYSCYYYMYHGFMMIVTAIFRYSLTVKHWSYARKT